MATGQPSGVFETMSDGSEDVEFTGSYLSRDGLRYSVTSLIDQFGRTDSVAFGAVVNIGLAAIGVLIWWFTSGWVSWAAAGWAALNLYPLVEWVMGL